MSLSDKRVLIGRCLAHRYRILRRLGEGGLGVVFLARDARRVEARDPYPYVAIKILKDRWRDYPGAWMALQAEARRMRCVASPHVVRVHDLDRDGDDWFMTMEYVRGTGLRTLIQQADTGGIPLPVAWPWIVQISRALRHAHSAGVAHGDVKPDNIIVSDTGVAKLIDFGAGWALRRELAGVSPAYASKELLEGRAPCASDDVYAFACVVAEALTGEHPFGREDAITAMRRGRVPPRIPSLGWRRSCALRAALAFQAERRTASIEDMVRGLACGGWWRRLR